MTHDPSNLFPQDQYVFLHDAILDALTYGDTVIPAEGLDDKVMRLEKGKMTEYQTEFDVSSFVKANLWY